VAVRPGLGPGLLATVLGGYDRSKDALPVETLFTRQQAAAVRDGTAHAGLMCSADDLTGLRTAELVTEAPVALLPARHPLASRPLSRSANSGSMSHRAIFGRDGL
jgi:DNA-binding transcriptional LysR family regulator